MAFYLERERGGGAKRGEEQEEEELNRTCLLMHKPSYVHRADGKEGNEEEEERGGGREKGEGRGRALNSEIPIKKNNLYIRICIYLPTKKPYA